MQDHSPEPTVHSPVLLQEAIALLALSRDATVVDATVGGGGHMEAILGVLGPKGGYIGIDADAQALLRARTRAHNDTRATFVHGNFRDIAAHLETLKVSFVHAILADLGYSSDQLALSGRGFSIDKDEPLLMTFADEVHPETLSAWHVVNEWSESSIADIIFGFGGETRARRIAAAICREREERPITTSRELALIIERAVPGRRSRIHPATKSFQAIRMAVNDELGALEQLLQSGIAHLADRGRMAVISFHSLEDRMVKHAFRNAARAEQGILLTDKPLVPGDEEQARNRRARSAKLRGFERRLAVR